MTNTIRERKADLSRRIFLLGALAVLVLSTLAAFRIVQSRMDDIANASHSAQELVRTLEAGVSATLQSAELVVDYAVLEVLKRERGRAGNMEDLPSDFIALAEPWSFIQSVGYIGRAPRTNYTVLRDESGRLIERRSSEDLSGRDTYSSHASLTRESDLLFLSNVRFGYVTETPIVIMSKGIWADDGQFLGIAAVGIRLSAITELFKAVIPRVNGAVMLLQKDGTLLISVPHFEPLLAGRPQQFLLLRDQVMAAPENVYDARIMDDNIARRIAYRAAPKYPIVVAIGLPMSDILAAWWRSMVLSVLAVAVSIVVIVTLTLSLARRIRDQQFAQEALRKSETKLKDLVECSSDYQWEIDENSIVTFFAGPGIENFSGIIGQPSHLFFSDTSEINDLSELQRRKAQRLPIRGMVFPARGKDGELRWVRNSSNPIFDSEGNFRGYRGVGTDITEVRHQRDLIEAQRKTEALGRLASGLAHEINNLLQPILIYSGLGTTGQDNDERVGYFSKIRRAAESASSIVRNALSFARRSPPRRENVELADAVKEMFDLAVVRIPKEIKVFVDSPTLDRWVVVDRTGLAQALTNLLTNSIEAMSLQRQPTGMISIVASDIDVPSRGEKFPGLSPGRYCRLSVTDNGPGIPPELLKDVFDPFFTTKAQDQGTGLGLSVVAGLVKSWGGIVTVASVPHEKTEFALYLRQAERQVHAAQ
jgi:PAS domain S-box-containing protein